MKVHEYRVCRNTSTNLAYRSGYPCLTTISYHCFLLSVFIFSFSWWTKCFQIEVFLNFFYLTLYSGIMSRKPVLISKRSFTLCWSYSHGRWLLLIQSSKSFFHLSEKKNVAANNKKNSDTNVQIVSSNLTLGTQGNLNRKISQLEKMFYLRCLLQLENGRLDKCIDLTLT